MTPAVEIVDVARRFGSVQALSGIDPAVEPGEFFGLLGPNGAGKTTLISILAGLTRADRGTARVLGNDVVADYRMARRMLGVVPQELVFDPFFTARETLRIQSGYFGIRDNNAWIDEILHHLDLLSKADANMRALSGGMKRRVLVGQALVHKPPVIVLDEPTAGVDVELRQSLWAFIRKLNRDGHTIILTTHYLEEAEALCSRIAMLKAGRIVALDTTQNLLSSFAGLTVRETHDSVFGGRVRYSSFLILGVVMMSVLQNAFANSSSSLVQSKITGNLIFVLLPSLSPLEIFGAYVLGAVIRGMVVGVGVLLVTLWFAPLSLAHPIWALAFALLGSAILGTLGVIAGIVADKFDQLAAFQNFLIMPLTFLSGVFYSIHTLPPFWQALVRFNPFFYIIAGFRYGFFW